LLCRLADGERVNDQVDWENVIEEVKSVGREQLHAVESLLVQGIIHMLKAEARPLARDRPHWQAEATRQLGDAADRFTPYMHQKIDLVRLYRRAVFAMPVTYDGQPPLPMSTDRPFTSIDELFAQPRPAAERRVGQAGHSGAG